MTLTFESGWDQSDFVDDLLAANDPELTGVETWNEAFAVAIAIASREQRNEREYAAWCEEAAARYNERLVMKLETRLGWMEQALSERAARPLHVAAS